MTRFLMIRSFASAIFVAILAAALPAAAADSPIGGTYLMKGKQGTPDMTMKIEAWGPGKVRLTYHVKGAENMELTIVSGADGKDAPLLLNGKPSGETMAIKLIDKLHSSTVIKMNGQVMGTSKGTFSPDFRTLTSENDMTAMVGNTPAGKSTQVWVRQ